MSDRERVEPFRKSDVEEAYWVSEFLPWLREHGFDPRNGQSVTDIFWWWYINVKFPVEAA